MFLRRLFSSAHGRSSNDSGFQVFREASKKANWDRTAIIDPSTTLTYGNVVRSVARLAATPRMQQVAPGDRVAFLLPRKSSYVIAQWTTWTRRAIAVPLCTSHPPQELAHVVADSRPRLVLFAPEFKHKIDETRNDDRVAALAGTVDFVEWSGDGDDAVVAANETGALDSQTPPLDKEGGALIIYTSGTTGKPKGVLTTYKNIEAQVASLLDAWRWVKDDKILLVLPLHHVHGVINVVTCALAAGATLEMAPEKLSPKGMWDRFAQGGLTLFMAVPTIYARLLEYYDSCNEEEQKKMRDSCKQFRLMVSGSAALPQPLFEKWEKVSGHRLLERYGMTEIGMALGNRYDGEREPGRVGVPFPNVQVKLDQETGELFVKGPQVFKEYWGNQVATKKAFDADGWFATGDVAAKGGPNDTWQILGRASVDIIKSGGYKLSALTIERELLGIPGVMDVAVLGVPDEIWGERVGAVVVYSGGVKAGQEAAVAKLLQEQLKTRLAKYEIPSVFHFCEQIPRNAMLKVIKKAIQFQQSVERTRSSPLIPQ